jgi:hypothetical protein
MTPELLKLYNHPYIQGKRGIWIDGDKYITPPSTFAYRYCAACDAGCDDVINPRAIWLPPLWSDDDPGRNLLGMVERLILVQKYRSKPGWVCAVKRSRKDESIFFDAPTPTRAVLKAIWAQQEGR